MDGAKTSVFCRLWRAQRWWIYFIDVRGRRQTFTDENRQEDAEW